MGLAFGRTYEVGRLGGTAGYVGRDLVFHQPLPRDCVHQKQFRRRNVQIFIDFAVETIRNIREPRAGRAQQSQAAVLSAANNKKFFAA